MHVVWSSYTDSMGWAVHEVYSQSMKCNYATAVVVYTVWNAHPSATFWGVKEKLPQYKYIVLHPFIHHFCQCVFRTWTLSARNSYLFLLSQELDFVGPYFLHLISPKSVVCSFSSHKFSVVAPLLCLSHVRLDNSFVVTGTDRADVYLVRWLNIQHILFFTVRDDDADLAQKLIEKSCCGERISGGWRTSLAWPGFVKIYKFLRLLLVFFQRPTCLCRSLCVEVGAR